MTSTQPATPSTPPTIATRQPIGPLLMGGGASDPGTVSAHFVK